MNKVLMATTNAGKAAIFKEAFKQLNIELVTLKDVGVITSPEENGKDCIENAVIKAKYYHELTKLPVFANDSGLKIYKFTKEDQAGLFVRRVNGVELTDEQMLENYVNKLNKVGGKSSGHFDVGLAIITKDGKLHTKYVKAKVFFVSKPSSVMRKGVPLDSLAYNRTLKKYVSEMTTEERAKTEGKTFLKQKQFIEKIFSKNNA